MKEEVKSEMQRHHFVWLLVVALNCADFALLEMLDLKTTRHREKQVINQKRRFIDNWLRQAIPKKAHRERVEKETSEQIAFMCEIQSMITLCDPTQLEWIRDQIMPLVLAANNRAEIERTKAKKTETPC